MLTMSKPLLDLTADDLMSRDLITIPQHMSLRAAAHALARAGVSGAPVTNAEGCCVGVLSATDLVRWLDRGELAARRLFQVSDCVCCDWEVIDLEVLPADAVGRYMTTDVVTARPETRVGPGGGGPRGPARGRLRRGTRVAVAGSADKVLRGASVPVLVQHPPAG